ncbi:alpha/beta fold hydrolase [Pseudonocardia eucalypti]|uniref:Alpha/beta fold hydrolase n=1 Tax=Pseudonocardia eucalypti TaxID=648755 RepID=A0ABP9QTS6_9PSEU|nr:pimeloyl-ACP methyl ester carboxylesterase [Pseudonocardia eucalypti]
MERFIEVEPGVRLWAEESGKPDGEPLLLVMGANAAGLAWPDPLVAALGREHRVIRYDHRDTGRSSRVFHDQPYPITRLASDAIAVLDGLGLARAHVAGMSLGGTLVQLLVLDHPDRLLTATLWSTAALGAWSPTDGESRALPGPDPALLELWQHMADPRDREAELDWRVAHWRLLRGDGPFDADESRRLEERIIEHSGGHENPAAHALADPSGLDRGPELAKVRTPTLVIDARKDPVNPPPHAEHLASVISGARLVVVPELGHALGSDVVPALTEEILRHTRR